MSRKIDAFDVNLGTCLFVMFVVVSARLNSPRRRIVNMNQNSKFHSGVLFIRLSTGTAIVVGYM